MQFKHPELLYALLLLLIPIIIHLFQLRRFQKVEFTNVKFLKNIVIQTRKSSQLKKWLTLITRLLLLAFVIIAFAQPFISKTDVFKGEVENVIYLDNSFSMQAKGNQGELLKRAAQDLIETLDADDEITLYTNNNTYRSRSFESIRNELLKIDYSPNQISYKSVIAKGKTLFTDEENSIKNLVIISDFQQKEEVLQIENDSLINIRMIKLEPVQKSNVQIDSAYIKNVTANSAELVVKVNHSGNADEFPISLYNNNILISKTASQKGDEAVFSISPNSKMNGMLSVDDINLQFDNQLYFSINEPARINVLIVNEEEDTYLKHIFTDDEFNLTSVTEKQLNFNIIEEQHLIILNELVAYDNALINALNSYKSEGGLLLVIPSEEGVVSSYNQLLNAYNIQLSNSFIKDKIVSNINFSHPIYKDVFENSVTNFQYPKVNTAFRVNLNTGVVLSFEDGNPFLLNRNNAFVFTAALRSKNSNFLNSPLIVPTLYNISKQSLKTPTLYYNIGIPNSFDISSTMAQDEIIKLIKGEEVIIPQQRSFNKKVSIETDETPSKAGNYALTKGADSLRLVSYNYSRKEGDLQYMDLGLITGNSIGTSIKNTLERIKSDSNVKELWKWFAIFALIFLIIEMLILKFFK